VDIKYKHINYIKTRILENLLFLEDDKQLHSQINLNASLNHIQEDQNINPLLIKYIEQV